MAVDCKILCCMTEQATDAVQSSAASKKDAIPPKVPKFEKSSSSSYSISNETLTKHLTALWERDDSTLPVTSAAPTSRAGSKRKAASVSSYLSACKPDVSLPSPISQPSTSTILSQLLSSCCGTMSLPASMSVISSNAPVSPRQRNILLMQNDRQVVATAKQPAAVNPSRRSTTESVSATNIFRLPSYEQVIGNRAALSSPLVNTDSTAGDVFVPSPQTGSSSFVANTTAGRGPSTVGASSLLLSQSSADNATIASHMQLDSSELLRQLEQILSEPGLTVTDIDNVLGAVPQSLPQSLSARDQKAISLIQSQLMSVEATPSSPAVASQHSSGTLGQLLSGNLPPTCNPSTDKLEMRLRGSMPPADDQPLLSAGTAAVRPSHVATGQYECVLCWLK